MRFLVLTLLFLIGCDASTPAAAPGAVPTAAPDAAPDAAIDSPERIEELKLGLGPFFLIGDETEREREIVTFAPGEIKTYSQTEETGYSTNILFRAGLTAEEIPAFAMTENGQPRVLRATNIDDEFDNEEIGTSISAPPMAAESWEFEVENLTDQPLLVQVVDYRREMTDSEKAMQEEVRGRRAVALKQKVFEEAREAWRANPEGDAPMKEDFGL